MRPASLAAPLAAILLSSTAALAQEGPPFEDVYVEVDGAAVLIPVSLALEACGLDEAAVQEAAAARLGEGGLDRARAPDAVAPAAAATADLEGAAAGTGAAAEIRIIAAEPGGEAGTTMTSGANDTTEAGNATTDLGNRPAGAAAPDAGAAPKVVAVIGGADADPTGAETVPAAEGVAGAGVTAAEAPATADPAPGADLLVLAICRVDVLRAAELGIPEVADGTVAD